MDKAKHKNGGDFKIAGNWSSWSKQIKEKFAKLNATDPKFEKPKKEIKIVK